MNSNSPLAGRRYPSGVTATAGGCGFWGEMVAVVRSNVDNFRGLSGKRTTAAP